MHRDAILSKYETREFQILAVGKRDSRTDKSPAECSTGLLISEIKSAHRERIRGTSLRKRERTREKRRGSREKKERESARHEIAAECEHQTKLSLCSSSAYRNSSLSERRRVSLACIIKAALAQSRAPLCANDK